MNTSVRAPSAGRRPPFIAIALASAIALGYEILLIRLFSVIQWHHFAYMIISLALLGYGASGTFLAVLFIPLFFVVVVRLFGSKRRTRMEEAAS